MPKKNSLFKSVSDYYSEKLRTHGAVPLGVDWNGVESQLCRFEQLGKIFPATDLKNATVLDFGSGYGAFLDYLESKHRGFLYNGIDISAEMITAASQQHKNKANVTFNEGKSIPSQVDYIIASGIFNVKLNNDINAWEDFIKETLEEFDRQSTRGFAFNCLTSYSDVEKMREHLYYANPLQLFEICKTHYSKNVALLHDYNLYEFTILVRKDS